MEQTPVFGEQQLPALQNLDDNHLLKGFYRAQPLKIVSMEKHINRQSYLSEADTLVVKVGSRVLSHPDGRLDTGRIAELADQLTQIAAAGKKIVLVSSGAVAAGMAKLGIDKRPVGLAQLQAVASVGQAHLIQAYERNFAEHGRHAAQVLLIADDLDDRQRYLNVRNTLLSLLEMDVIPIINENDSVAVDELLTTFGDNDRLAAMVSGLFSRPALVILSDVEGVFDKSPEDESATVISTISKVNSSTLNLACKAGSGMGKGGMASKLRAAKFVTQSGVPVIIAGGKKERVLTRLMSGEELGTFFLPNERPLAPKKRWIGFTAQVTGKIQVDAGAAKAVTSGGTSLLAIGITATSGDFEKGDVVSISDASGGEIARGLTNYSSRELEQIKGLRSLAIPEILGHCPYEEVIHSDNMALMHITD